MLFDNIIFCVGGGALGDEMSMTRNCILDLLYNNYITKDVVIYCNKDRSFLYENIFCNIFYTEEYTVEKLKETVNFNFSKK
jgi:hypothetical protein